MTIRSLLTLRCPVCGKGKLFRGYFDTPHKCPECGYYFMRETGYFLPHVPIGYALTVLAALSVWPLLRYVAGVESDAIILVSMITVGICFGVWVVRYAKMLWLVIDLTIHPPAQEDFQSRGRN
jgi:hypothetical protein